MTKIEWVINPDGTQGRTWNPLTGCSKVSTGCKNCFAETMAKRLKAMGRPEYQEVINGNGRWTGKVVAIPERLEEPLKRRKPTTYFVNSMSDLFHPDVPDEFIIQVFARMTSTEHTFQVLTKRPERMCDFVNRHAPYIGDWHNIWLGTSIEDQKAADERIPFLLQTPAAVRFLSCEPLLGAIDLKFPLQLANEFDYERYIDGHYTDINWVIVGGESGPHARPMHPDWARSLRDQCQAAGVPVFIKQMGSVWAKDNAAKDRKGGDWNEWPVDLRVREFPQNAHGDF